MRMMINCIRVPIYFSALIFMLLHTGRLCAQTSGSAKTAEDSSLYSRISQRHISYTIIEAPGNTFGYDVFVNGRKFIHQACIPTLSGNKGFKTKGDANKVALLVVDKLKKGNYLPTVTATELKHFKIIN